jgi:nitrite reductase/ring-hydroxylating ferredoxin subunit
MERIANAQDLERGESLKFEYEGKQAILVRTRQNKLVAYHTACPHKGASVTLEAGINKLVCSCHLSLFNVEDGSIYKSSAAVDKVKALTPLELELDTNQDVYVI